MAALREEDIGLADKNQNACMWRMATPCTNFLLLRKEVPWWKFSSLPMNQHTCSPIKPFLDESVACRKMLNDVLVFHVIKLDDVVLEIEEELFIKRQPQGG